MKAFLLPTLAVFAASRVAAEPVPVVPGEGFQVESYAVSVRPDLASTAVSGFETVVLRATSDSLTRLAFTLNALRVTGATADAEPVEVATNDGAIVFTMPRALAKGDEVTLRFSYAGIPARGVTKVPDGLYTSYFACDWMVCLQDSPGDKAHLALDLWLPAGIRSLGVGRALPTTVQQDGVVLHQWRSTRPTSSYLYAYAAGPFAERSVPAEAGELRYLDATGTEADLAGLFADAPAIAAFLSDKAGLPLPDGGYAQLLVPGREPQEAASHSLIGLGELKIERDDSSSAWVVTHEMAHQWWGNLVTCETWTDFWLNEGVATFMVAAWKQHRFGEAAYQAELDVARRRVARVRESGFDKPLAWAGKYPTLGAWRAVQYSKGALFLAHLRERIGDEAFWAGLRSYTRAHAGGTVVSRDFQDAMEDASGGDLSGEFDEWVYGAAVG